MKVDSHCDSTTASLPSFILPLLAPKSAKSREIPRKFEFIVGHDHRSRFQLKAHMRLLISH